MRAARFTISLISAAVMLAAPALASGAQSLAITSPTGFPAGGDPSYTTTIGLDTSAGTPSSLALRLMPGVLASPAAAPSCVKGSPQHTSACEIGTGSVSILGLPGAPLVNAYLVPPPNSSDLVGIDLVSGSLLTIHAGGKLVQTSSGNVQVVLSVPLSSLGPLAGMITGMSLTIGGTLDGKPFNRMPTNCSPGQSTLTVVYANKTEPSAASPDFKPTGCSSLPFAPHISATAQQTGHGGAAVVTTVTQALAQAASRKTTLHLPASTLVPNINAIQLQNKSVPVGTATASSPLLPQPLRGKIYLVGSALSPELKFQFPPPAELSLIGVIKSASNSVTIPVIPDVPMTSLVVSFPGGRKALLAAYCTSPTATVTAHFTGQNGKLATANKKFHLTGCPST